MKHGLWLINSSLVIIFALALAVFQFLDQEPEVWHQPKISINLEPEKKKDEVGVSQIVWSKIYQDDIFCTYVPVEIKVTKNTLLTPIPEQKTIVPIPQPEVKKQEFVPPLTITLRGIITSGDETKSVVMIADETNKEGMYHLGEKIKDAQIIKILHNRIILLRANGQQEVFYLRKDDIPSEQSEVEKWKYIVKKIDDQTFEIDPQEFVKEVETLGNFIERSSIIGTAYNMGKPIGIRVGKIELNTIASALGLMDNDIIVSINGFDVSSGNNRVKAYEAIIQLNIGDVVQLGLKRVDRDMILVYKFVKIDKPRKSRFPGVRVTDIKQQPSQEEILKMNRLQQREQTMRQFSQQHVNQQQQQQTMMEIRKRILDGLQQRLRDTRNHQ